MPMVMYESMMMVMAINIVVVQPTLPSVSKQQYPRCHPADIVLDNNILLSHAICPSLCRYGLVTRKIVSEIERTCINYIIACSLIQHIE